MLFFFFFFNHRGRMLGLVKKPWPPGRLTARPVGVETPSLGTNGLSHPQTRTPDCFLPFVVMQIKMSLKKSNIFDVIIGGVAA